jgi:hypothetical protein
MERNSCWSASLGIVVEFLPLWAIQLVMYKNLFIRLWQVVRYPANVWKDVSETTDTKKSYLSEFFYPLVGLASFAAFISCFFGSDLAFKQQIMRGVQLFAVSFGSLFAGFFLSSRVLNWAFVRWFGLPSRPDKAELLTVYSQAPVLAISVLTQLIAELFFLKLLFLYVFAIVWEAAINYYEIPPKLQGRFTLLAGAVILVSPQLIEIALKLLLPGLK